MQPNNPSISYGYPSQQQTPPDLEQPQNLEEHDEQPASTPAASSHAVGDVVTVDTLDPITGAQITGPVLVTAVHDDDEDGSSYSVAPLTAFGFRVPADQLTVD